MFASVCNKFESHKCLSVFFKLTSLTHVSGLHSTRFQNLFFNIVIKMKNLLKVLVKIAKKGQN